MGVPRVPAPPNATVGRDALRAEVVDAVLGDARLVTLTGPGGTGKSRVATVAALAAQDRFEEVCFLATSESTEPDALARAVAQALGGTPGDDSGESLAGLPGGRSVLLVLDNLEALPDAADVVRRVVDAAPDVTVLATSRVPLRLPGELEVPVPPLDLPSAVELFGQRAVTAQPGFEPAGNEQQVADLCRLLDGVPLALELAAARLKLVGLDRIGESLRTDVDLLSTASPDVPERQRALATTIQWSYDRLDADARRVCDRLALFEGGFTAEAVEAICDDVASVLDSLGAITDARLVRTVPSRVAVRFVLPGTVRAFLRPRLRAHDDVGRVHERLAVHLLGRLRTWADGLDGPYGQVSLGSFEDEAADVEATVDWALEAGRRDLAVELTLAAADLWVASGRLHEARRRTAQVREYVAPRSRDAGRLHAATATYSYHLSEFAQAAEEARAALDVAEAVADEATAATARCYLGAALVVSGDPAEGGALAGRALEDAERLGLYPLTAVALSVLAIARAIAGDFPGERETYLRRLDVVRRHGDLARTADTLNTLAEIALDEADAEGARAYATESLSIAEVRLPLEARDTLITLARAALVDGDADEAAALLTRALALTDRIGQSLALAQALRVAGCLSAARGGAGTGVRLFAAAETLSPSPSGTGEPVEQDLATGLTEARQTLGGTAADREWQIGAALPLASVRRLLEQVLTAP